MRKCGFSDRATMLLYHYTDSESLVEIVKDKLILATEGSVFDQGAKESVFFTTKVNFDIQYLKFPKC